MGCGASTLSENEPVQLFSNQKFVSEAIDRSLLSSNKAQKRFVKLFLLGAGESGKSTMLKQMRLVHQQAFSDFERRQYTEVIWFDLIESMKLLLYNARRLKIPLDCDVPGSPLEVHKRVLLLTMGINDYAPSENSIVDTFNVGYQTRRHLLNAQDSELALLLDAADDGQEFRWESSASQSSEKRVQHSRNEIALAIKQLWARDLGIVKCFQQAHKFQLESSAEYHFENVDKFKDPNHRCLNQDILMGRIKTTGITENVFEVKGTKLKVLDAGGQRSERKKWLHCFQDIDAVMFVFAVLEYDQTLYEDNRVNRMHESFALFNALCNSRWFIKTPFILILNKVDLLQKKLPRSNIKDYFPEYTGDSLNVDQVLDFLKDKILSLDRTKKPIYVHRTCATDTETMPFVIKAVTDVVIQESLKLSGIM